VERKDRVEGILEEGIPVAAGNLAVEDSLAAVVDCMEPAASLGLVAGTLTVVAADSPENVDGPVAVDSPDEEAGIPAAAGNWEAAGNPVVVDGLAETAILEAVGSLKAVDIPEEVAGDILAADILGAAAGTDFDCKEHRAVLVVEDGSLEEADSE